MHLMVLALVAAIGSPQVQPTCAAQMPPACSKIDDTVDNCLARAAKPDTDKIKAMKAAEADKAKAAIHATPTGANSTTIVSSSSKKDLLSVFSALIQSASLDNKNQDLTLTYAPTASGDAPGLDFQVQAILHQPQLYAALKDDLNKSGDASQESDLQQKLNNFDDFEAVATLGLNNPHFGRHFHQYDQDFQNLFSAYYVRDHPSDGPAVRAFHGYVKNTLQVAHPKDSNGIPFSELSEQECQDIMPKLVAAVQEKSGPNADFERDRQYINVMTALVGNQPQLTGSLSYRNRSAYVGPREGTVEVSWEQGLTDLNRYRCDIPKSCEKSPSTLDTWEKDMGGLQKALARQANFKLSVQYSYLDRYSVVLPADFSLMMPVGHRFSGSATLGSLVTINGTQVGRIDGALEYDNYSDDPMNKDHLVASLTYTQKINGSLTLPIGIAYANHADFLNDVQERFSAHFGLRFKFDTTSGTQTQSSTSQAQTGDAPSS